MSDPSADLRSPDAPADHDVAVHPSDGLHWIAPPDDPRALVVVLHGLDMTPTPLVPLLRSMRLPAWIAVPAGPVERSLGQRAWWPVDDAARRARLAAGPADLRDTDPPGRDAARAVVHAAVEALRAASREHASSSMPRPTLPLVLAGFSQGAMLALDCALRGLDVDGLALWSASRLAFHEGAPALARLRGVPVHLVHGRADANLALAAGEALRDALVDAGAAVRWSAFDGGHEIALPAWVGLRRLVRDVVRVAGADAGTGGAPSPSPSPLPLPSSSG